MSEGHISISTGKQATLDTFKKANELVLASICLTGNPGIRVSNQPIINVVKLAKEHFYGLIIAEKCTALRLNEPVVGKNIIASIIDAGADIIMAPTKGAVSGVRNDLIYHAINYSHTRDAVMFGIGPSKRMQPKT